MELTGGGLAISGRPAPQTAEATSTGWSSPFHPGRPSADRRCWAWATVGQLNPESFRRGKPCWAGRARSSPRARRPRQVRVNPSLDSPDRPAPGGGIGFGSQSASAALIAYVEANQGDATYLIATTNANSAAPIILAIRQAGVATGRLPWQ